MCYHGALKGEPAYWSSYHESVTQQTVGMSEVLGECVGLSRTANVSVLWEWQNLALGLREGRAFLCCLWSDWKVDSGRRKHSV